jgi:AraC-like DNA-binding protein
MSHGVIPQAVMDTNKLGAPAAPAHRFETQDPDELAELLAPFSSDADLRVWGTNRQFRAQGVGFRTPRIGTFRIGVSCAEAFSPPPSVVSVTMPLSGQIECSWDTPALQGFESGEAYGTSPERPMRLRATGDSTFLVLHLDPALVRGQMSSVSGDEAADLPNVPLNLSLAMPCGAAFWRRVASFWRALNSDTGLHSSALTVDEAECALALDLVRAIASQPTDRTSKTTGTIGAAGLRRAEEYLMANVGNAVCLAEVCRETKVSVRTLTRAFASAHGLGPMGFLKQRRFEATNRALLAADSAETRVTDVALQYGFFQMGRFAVEYRRIFHESPSQTLRR